MRCLVLIVLVIIAIPSAHGSEPDAATRPKRGVPRNIDELLRSRTSIHLERGSIEVAVHALETLLKAEHHMLPFKLKIMIKADDLKSGGITLNQQVSDLHQDNTTVAEILTAIVMKANPVRNVKTPSSRSQSLIWVIAEDADDRLNRVILITTRHASRGRYTLPKAFQSK